MHCPQIYNVADQNGMLLEPKAPNIAKTGTKKLCYQSMGQINHHDM